jgi:hypothetical protein
MRTIIQVPVDKKLRDRAVAAAEKMGFSSLQDLLRLFLEQFVEHKIEVGFYNPADKRVKSFTIDRPKRS